MIWLLFGDSFNALDRPFIIVERGGLSLESRRDEVTAALDLLLQGF